MVVIGKAQSECSVVQPTIAWLSCIIIFIVDIVVIVVFVVIIFIVVIVVIVVLIVIVVMFVIIFTVAIGTLIYLPTVTIFVCE